MQFLGEEGIELYELLPQKPGVNFHAYYIRRKRWVNSLPPANANRPLPQLENVGGLRPPLSLILFITMFPALPIGIYSSLSSLLCLSMLVSLAAMSLSTSFQFSFDVSKVTQNDIIG